MRAGRILAIVVVALCLVAPPLVPNVGAVEHQAAIEKQKAFRAKKQRRSKRQRRAARRRRAAAKKKRANRPKGWQWPPTPAMKAQGRKCRTELTKLGVQAAQGGRDTRLGAFSCVWRGRARADVSQTTIRDGLSSGAGSHPGRAGNREGRRVRAALFEHLQLSQGDCERKKEERAESSLLRSCSGRLPDSR